MFAFVLEPNQVDRFHDQLKAALPGLVEQRPLDPGIATQLADIEHGAVASPRRRWPRSRSRVKPWPFARCRSPAARRSKATRMPLRPDRPAPGTSTPIGTALRQGRGARLGSGVAAPSQADLSAVFDRGTFVRPNPVAGFDGPGGASSQLALEQKSVVLVWVARPAADCGRRLAGTNAHARGCLIVMIHVDRLSKRFGSFKAVDGIRFDVGRGEIVGLLGPNGAGKTTTMRMLTTYLSPTSGRATLAGHDVLDEPLEVRRKVGYLPENVPLYHGYAGE